MTTYQVDGTTRSQPGSTDWEPIITTDDPVEAVRVVHETEGTFWRRLIEDGRVVFDRA